MGVVANWQGQQLDMTKRIEMHARKLHILLPQTPVFFGSDESHTQQSCTFFLAVFNRLRREKLVSSVNQTWRKQKRNRRRLYSSSTSQACKPPPEHSRNLVVKRALPPKIHTTQTPTKF